MSDTRRRQALEAALEERILVLDGATGTAFQAAGLGPDDFGDAAYEGCNEHLVLTRPDVVRALHGSYLEVGCDVVETNTFGATPLVLAEYGLEAKARKINREAARIAREACAAYDTPSRTRFVAGSMGPTTKAISVTGGVTFDELVRTYREQALGLVEGGVDYLLLETCQDTRNVKAALIGIEGALASLGVAARHVPVAVSGTIEPSGTMLAGQDVEALVVSLEHLDLLYLGLNCATGPELMSDHLRTLSAMALNRVACVPNAGLPDSDGNYPEGPVEMARTLSRFANRGWLNLAGGCCGTTPDHVRALLAALDGLAPRMPSMRQGTWFSGIDAIEVDDQTRPVIVGERTNVLGSRKFKRLVQERRFEEAAEVARAQVKGGAHLIDVCLQDPDSNELDDVEAFFAEAVQKVKVPFVIDTTDAHVMERALRWCQGRSLLNSVNLENGRERFDEVVPLAKRFGAALVVGLIDEDPEQGMAITVARKLEIAKRSHRILVEELGLRDADIVWDPLVFPCGTGDRAYADSARQTVEGVRALKAAFPETKTILGISNVSFGLPPGAREVLNSVFLYHCVQAGLDLAIVNSERLERYPTIPEAERRLAEDLIFGRGADPLAAFTAHFRACAPRKPGARPAQAELSVAERLEACIIEGTKEGLHEALDEALADPTWPEPLDIVNGPLMAGMAEVGRLFDGGELIVAEVLQSASAMKAAVSHLEPHLERSGDAKRGKILLATVKGDVHDIGKNLVDIVLSNNGFEVVDLGIKVHSERLVEEARRLRPDAIGLSGLLVKSAHMMVSAAEDFASAGIDVPLLVGGAALSPAFAYGRIAPAHAGPVAHARDAMHGLALARRLLDEDTRSAVLSELEGEVEKAARREAEKQRQARAEEGVPGEGPVEATPVEAAVSKDVELPPAPPLERVALAELDLDEVWRWINPQMLYGKHLGLRGSVARLAEDGDARYRMLEEAVEAVQAACREGAMRASAVFRFCPVAAGGDRVVVIDPASGDVLPHFDFPRQARGQRLCLADYVISEQEAPDHLGFFVTTAGAGIRQRVGELRERGHYLESHVLGALAVETAEAAAEWLHAKLRSLWGFPDPPDLTMRDRLRGKYRGCRYSPGYPACPDLEDQTSLFSLLRPAEIGVTLTEGFMMDPEASVSAIVFHHPEARYFAT